MAIKYCWSGAAGGGTGADWANAYTTLTLAIVGLAAGDTLYVANDHNESTAGAVTLTFPGTAAARNRIICVNRAGSVPPVSADLVATPSGQVTTTGANSLSIRGNAYFWGMIFSSGSGAVSTALQLASAAGDQVYDNCTCKAPGTTGTSGKIIIGTGSVNISANCEWINTTPVFGATADGISVNGGIFKWHDTPAAITAPLPAQLFRNGGSQSNAQVEIQDVDLSAMTAAASTIVAASGSSQRFYIVDCVLHANFDDGGSSTIATTPTFPGSSTELIRSGSSGAAKTRRSRYSYSGTQTTEYTIFRTGGATDGLTPIALKIVTTANACFERPFEAQLLAEWNDTTGSAVNVNIYGIAAALPKNDEIWIEARFLGASGNPLGTVKTTRKADILAAGANVAADASAWGGSTTPFVLQATLSSPFPAQSGLVYVTVKAAKASTTYYIDPKVVFS